MFFFLVFSIAIFFHMASTINSTGSFLKALEEVNIGLLVSILFFICGIGMLFTLFKKPKRYSAKLISKNEECYQDKNVTSMIFELWAKENDSNKTCECFTYEQNELVVGKTYDVYVKEFNWEIRKVDCSVKNDIKTLPSQSPLLFCFILIQLILGFDISLGILGIIYYKKYFVVYVIWIIFHIALILYSIKFFSQLKSDNVTKKDALKILSRYEILSDSGKTVNNLIVRDLLINLLSIPLLWSVLLFLLGFFTVTNKVILFFPVLVPEIAILISILFHINYDAKLVKKYGLSTLPLTSVKGISDFKIIRSNTNTNFEKYFIINEDDNNLIYNVQKTGLLRKKYVVYSTDGKLVAEIRRFITSLCAEYVVRPINLKPFIIRVKNHVLYDCEIHGLDSYHIEGDVARNIIMNNNNEIVASILTKEENNNWYSLGDTETHLNECENNINIILISLCVTIGNLEATRRNF